MNETSNGFGIGSVSVVTCLKSLDTERIDVPSIVWYKRSEKILLTSATPKTHKA